MTNIKSEGKNSRSLRFKAVQLCVCLTASLYVGLYLWLSVSLSVSVSVCLCPPPLSLSLSLSLSLTNRVLVWKTAFALVWINGKHTNTTETKQHKLVTVNKWVLMSLGFRAQASCVKVEVAVLGSPSLIRPYGFCGISDITSYGGKSKRAIKSDTHFNRITCHKSRAAVSLLEPSRE